MDLALLALYLSAAFVGGLLARAVRLPPMVGFLAAGFTLQVAGAEDLAGLDFLADLGVTLLLFAIGLKLDVRSLLRREVWLPTFAHLAFSVAVAAGVLALLLAARVTLVADETLSSLLLLGFALSFSSTVFVVKVLEERSDTASLYGRVAIGVLVLQDVLAVVFLTTAAERPPSPWALALVGLLPAAWLVRKVWDRLGHGEMQVLFGLLVALVPGYALFDAVGLKGDLGALVMGLLLASHPGSRELSRSLWSLKELLLVGFFLSIGLTGAPTWDALAVASVLVLLVPLQGVAYLLLFWAAGLRHRSSALAALALSNHSEFGLIVVAVGSAAGWLEEEWLVVLALAVGLSFLLSAALNRHALALAAWLEGRLPAQAPERLHLLDRPVDVGDAQALVLGMGRVGRAAYARLRDEHDLEVLGVEHDERRVTALLEGGLQVVAADATDREFWQRVLRADRVRVAVLAMPFHGSNLDALAMLRACGFTGAVAAVAQYDDDADELRRLGADAVFHLYGGAGRALADGLAEVAARSR